MSRVEYKIIENVRDFKYLGVNVIKYGRSTNTSNEGGVDINAIYEYGSINL